MALVAPPPPSPDSQHHLMTHHPVRPFIRIWMQSEISQFKSSDRLTTCFHEILTNFSLLFKEFTDGIFVNSYFISYIGIFNDAPSYPFFHSDLDIKRKFQFKSRFQNSNSAAILFDTYFAGFLYALNYRAFVRETKYTLEEPEQSSFHLTDGLSRSTVCCLGLPCLFAGHEKIDWNSISYRKYFYLIVRHHFFSADIR